MSAQQHNFHRLQACPAADPRRLPLVLTALLAWLHHHSCLQWRVCPDCVSASEPERATIASARASAARRPRAMVRTFAVAQRFQCALVAQQCLARLHDEAKLGVHRVHACLLRLLRARERDTVWSARAGTRCQAAGRFGARERAFSALGASAGAGAASFFVGGIFARRRLPKWPLFLWGKSVTTVEGNRTFHVNRNSRRTWMV